MAKIAHFADLQLGFNIFDGRRSSVREQDFYHAWIAAAEESASREVDVVVLAGDIFEHDGSVSRPISPATYNTFNHGLDILAEAGIDTVVVSGNHDTPRVFNPSNHPLIVPSGERYHANFGQESALLELRGLTFQLIPWVHNKPLTESDFGPADVCVLHAPCPVISPAYGGTRQFDPSFAERYRYVALGDWHDYKGVTANAFYSGSLERTAFGQLGSVTGGMFVDLSGDGDDATYWSYDSREMQEFLISEDPDKFLEELIDDTWLDESTMVRVIFKGVDPTRVSSDLLSKLYDRFEFVKINWTSTRQSKVEVELPTTAPVQQMWLQYCQDVALEQAVQEAGTEALQEVC